MKGVTKPSSPSGRPGFLSDVIVELGMVDAETVEQAVNAARMPGRTVTGILVESGALTEDQLSRAIGERYGIDHLDLGELEVDAAAANLITPSAAKRYDAVPVAFTDDGALIVAMADPTDSLAINDVAVMARFEVRPAVASLPDLEALRQRLPLGAPDKQAEHERSSAVLWQADGEAAPARAGQPPPEQPPAAASAPTAAEPSEAVLERLRADIEAQHRLELEQLEAGYESKLRARERSAGELREELEAERAESERTVARLRAELEAEKRELERRLEAERAAAHGAAQELEQRREEQLRQASGDRHDAGELEALHERLAIERAGRDLALAEARDEYEAQKAEHERTIRSLGDQLERGAKAHERALAELREELAGERAAQERLAREREELDHLADRVTALDGELEDARAEAQRNAESALERAAALEEADQRAGEAGRDLIRIREESERQSRQHALAERDLRTALEAEEERRRALERRTFELESVASEAKQLIEDMERAGGRLGRALDALDGPGHEDGADAPRPRSTDGERAEDRDSASKPTHLRAIPE